jgi:hypothetical protein
MPELNHYTLKAPLNLFDQSDQDRQLLVATRYLKLIANSFTEANEDNPDFRVTFLKELARRGLNIMSGKQPPYPDVK